MLSDSWCSGFDVLREYAVAPLTAPSHTHDAHGFLHGDRQLGIRDAGQVAQKSRGLPVRPVEIGAIERS